MHHRFLVLFFLLCTVSAAPLHAENIPRLGEAEREHAAQAGHADRMFAVNMAFFTAAQTGNVKVLQALLKAGADVNRQDERGNTALELATIYGQTQAVSVLLQAGADPGVNNGTAAMLAELMGHDDIADLLRQAGAKTTGDAP